MTALWLLTVAPERQAEIDAIEGLTEDARAVLMAIADRLGTCERARDLETDLDGRRLISYAAHQIGEVYRLSLEAASCAS